MVERAPTHYIYDVAKGSAKNKKIFFKSYAEAKRYTDKYIPGEKGIYHIYPVNADGYASKRDGRRSFH